MPAAKKTATRKVGVRRSAVSGKGAYKSAKAPKYYKRYRAMKEASSNETVGEKIGKTLGGWAQKAIKAITGFGDYHLPNYDIKKNVILEETNSPPEVTNRGHEFIVRHREYIKDIYAGLSTNTTGPSVFNIEGFSINPGLLQTFPWFAAVAQNFEQYEIQGMLFEYKSMFSDAAVQVGGSLGTVIMATEYNAASAPFANKIVMENYEYAQSSKPSLSMCHPVECARHLSVLSELYVRNDTLDVAQQDIKTYDFGKFYIATQGVPSNNTVGPSLGELWVTYQIRLIKPKIAIDYIDSGYSRWSHPAQVVDSGGNIFQDPTGWQQDADSTLNVQILDDRTIQIPLFTTERRYEVLITVSDPTNSTSQAAAIGWFPGGSPVASNATLVSGYTPATFQVTNVSGSVITSSTTASFVVQTLPLGNFGPYATVLLPAGGMPATKNVVSSMIVNAIPVA